MERDVPLRSRRLFGYAYMYICGNSAGELTSWVPIKPFPTVTAFFLCPSQSTWKSHLCCSAELAIFIISLIEYWKILQRFGRFVLSTSCWYGLLGLPYRAWICTMSSFFVHVFSQNIALVDERFVFRMLLPVAWATIWNHAVLSEFAAVMLNHGGS